MNNISKVEGLMSSNFFFDNGFDDAEINGELDSTRTQKLEKSGKFSSYNNHVSYAKIINSLVEAFLLVHVMLSFPELVI